MKDLSTWLLAIFAGMFWIFRLIVAVCTQYGIDLMGIATINLNIEVILLFITLVCIALIIKGSVIGAAIYMISYVYYFGQHLCLTLPSILNGGVTLSMSLALNIIVDLLALFLALMIFIDSVIRKTKNTDKKSRKTDWYFKEEKYDKEVDDRIDKNHYKFL